MKLPVELPQRCATRCTLRWTPVWRLCTSHLGDARGTRAGAAATVALAAWAVWTAGPWDTSAPERKDAPVALPASSRWARALRSATSQCLPREHRQAVATLRQDQPAVVFVRVAGSTSQDVVWSAPTQHEIGDRNLPWPVAVSWAPDEDRIAILIAQERGRVDEKQDLVDVSLLTVAPDGTSRELIDEVGTCACTDRLAEMAWALDGLVEIEPTRWPRQGPAHRGDAMTNSSASCLVRRRAARMLTVGLVAAGLVGCGGSPTDEEDSRAAPAAVSAASSVGSPQPTVEETSGMYDVGGHKLYMSCAGEGPVTVVYVHGWVNDAGYVPHNSALQVRDSLADEYRVCLYDRRNVGSSEAVDAVQSPADMLRDMEKVLEAGGVEPPYILMAASFGGLVASAYLAAHPESVHGMVLIDTMFPDELRLDRFLPRDSRFVYFLKDDRCCTLERIAQFDLIRSLQASIGKEPDIPVVYLASEQEPRNQNSYESPEYDARILGVQKAFVERFSPGILRWVDAPHFMEPVVPEVIADAVREVDQLASTN